MANSIIELYTQVPADLEGNVFGQFDEHLKLTERTLNVTLISRDGMLKILGTEQSETQNIRTAGICRTDPKENDRIWNRTCRNR